MILVDVNLLVDATMSAGRDHEAARSWLEQRLDATARVGLPWASLTGFVRVAAQPRAWESPLTVGEALSTVRSWLARPCAWVSEPGPRHLEILDDLMAAAPSVRLLTDAHLAAIALEHGLELISRDRDFARWSSLGLRSSDLLAWRPTYPSSARKSSRATTTTAAITSSTAAVSHPTIALSLICHEFEMA